MTNSLNTHDDTSPLLGNNEDLENGQECTEEDQPELEGNSNNTSPDSVSQTSNENCVTAGCSNGQLNWLLKPWDVFKASDSFYQVIGGAFALIAGCCFTGSDFVLQEFRLDYVEVLLMRCFLQIVSNAIFMKAKGYQFWPTAATNKAKLFMILNSIFSALRMVCIYSSLLLLPLGDAITIFFTIPLFTMVFAFIFLRTPIKLWKVTFGFFLMLGIVLIVRPPFLFPPDESGISADIFPVLPFWSTNDEPVMTLGLSEDEHTHLYYFGVLLALGVALFGALANVAVAVCGSNVDSSVLIFYCGIICIPVGLVASSFDPHQRFISREIVNIPASEWGELILQSSLSLSGTILVTLSIKMANPIVSSVLTPVVEIVLGYIIQTTVMGDTPDAMAVSGATIVIASVVGITLEKLCVSKIPEGCRNYW